MSNITELKARARQIKEATQSGENTAARVGGLLWDMIDLFEDVGGIESLAITPHLNSGVKIASFNINGNITPLYAPSSNSGSDIENHYDDTGLWNAIEQLNAALKDANTLAAGEKTRLDGVVEDIEDNVKDKMQEALAFAAWLQANLPKGEAGYQAGWDEKMKEYLQTVGLWDGDEESTNTKWSYIRQNYDKLQSAVIALSEGKDLTELLEAAITEGIKDGAVSIDLETVYASKDVEDIVEWMYSALKNSSSSDKSFNELVSSGKNGFKSAISEIRTYIEKLKDGDYVATADMEAKVNDSITGLYSKATSKDATTTIFSQVKKDSEDIASIVQSITGDNSSTTIANKIDRWKAGLLTEATLSDALAGLIVSDEFDVASILLKINEDSSEAKISADKINLEGITTLYDSYGNARIVCDAEGIHMGKPNYSPDPIIDITGGSIQSSLASGGYVKSFDLNFGGAYFYNAEHTPTANPENSGYITSKSVGLSHYDSEDEIVDFQVSVEDATYKTNLYINNNITADNTITGKEMLANEYNVKVAGANGSVLRTYNGTSTYMKIGDYYFMFLNGILVYCSTRERDTFEGAGDSDVQYALEAPPLTAINPLPDA